MEITQLQSEQEERKEQAEGGEVAAGGGVVLARNQKQINEFMQHL